MVKGKSRDVVELNNRLKREKIDTSVNVRNTILSCPAFCTEKLALLVIKNLGNSDTAVTGSYSFAKCPLRTQKTMSCVFQEKIRMRTR